MSQISSGKSVISVNISPLTNLEVLHKRKEFEAKSENILSLDKDDFLKDKGIVETRVERGANNNSDRDKSRSLALITQNQVVKDRRPERSSTNLLQVINSQNNQLILLKSENMQVLQPEKTPGNKTKRQQENISVLKERNFLISENRTVIPQRTNEITKHNNLNGHRSPSSNPENSPEKSTKSSQVEPPKEPNRQKLIDDTVNRPFSFKEPYEAYRDFNKIDRELRPFDRQHITAAEAFARRYGPHLTRAFGFGNEFSGLLSDLGKSIVDKSSSGDVFERFVERMLRQSTSFEFKDLIDNEIGIGLAGYRDYSHEILEIVKANPKFYALYSKEIASNPFKHYAVENRERFGLGISTSTRRPSERYSLGIASPVNTPTSRYNLRVDVLPPQKTYKTSGQTKANTSNRDEINRGDGHDRSQGAGGKDAGQRERNRESGHKGYGGPQ